MLNEDKADETVSQILAVSCTVDDAIDMDRLSAFCAGFTISYYMTARGSAEFAQYMVHIIEGFADVPESIEIKAMNLVASINDELQ